MKVRIMFKDPDGVWDSLEEAGLDPNHTAPDVEKALRKFIEFSEYVTIEIDTETQTATVVPVR